MLILLMCLPIATFVGCGSGSDGETTFSDGGASVTYPAAWKRAEIPQDDDSGIVLSVLGPGERGTNTRLTLHVQPRFYQSVAQFSQSLADQGPGMVGRGRPQQHPVTVDGATTARMVTFDFDLKGSDGSPVPARAVQVATIENDRQYLLVLAGPRDRMADEQVAAILKSLRIG